MKAILLVALGCFYLVIMFVFFPFESDLESPMLRARLGTVLWHSSDQNGIYQAANQDYLAVDHVYCYYPKSAAASGLILVRKDDGDCSNYLGEAIIHESPWVSEREKYWWDPSSI